MAQTPTVAVTGLGMITSVGNDQREVIQSLRDLRHGFELYPPFDDPLCPVRVTGTIKGFLTDGQDREDWTYPSRYQIKREILRSLPPHGLYAYCAMVQALEDAGLQASEICHPRIGLFTASGGSVSVMYDQLSRMNQHGIMRCNPLGIISSVAGTLSFNLAAAFGIQGSTCGFASACASSGHALGYAHDEITLGRQDRVIVVGGEDGNRESILPFAGMRALSLAKDTDQASRPFDRNRNGFVGTGGGVVMVLEREDLARARGAKIYARMRGWGQSSDGHNVAIPHPDGEGLVRAMKSALETTQTPPGAVDYINAHATSTLIGDLSEIRAIKTVFEGCNPAISSTKAISGHGLSLASIMEAAFTVLAMRHGFTPGSAHITELEPEAEGLNILRQTEDRAPSIAMSNSSGFGGANVALVFERTA